MGQFMNHSRRDYEAPLQLSYDDILLQPNLSDISSRSEISLETQICKGIGGKYLTPIVSAPMDTVSNIDVVALTNLYGGLGILHRFMPANEQLAAAKELKKGRVFNFGVAIGVREDPLPQVARLYEAKCKIFLIDVANGYMQKVADLVKQLKDLYGDDEFFKVIAGNVCTAQGAGELAYAGADAIRVGIGNGSVCTTRDVTGVGAPQFTAVARCAQAADEYDVPIIADGGIRHSGDIVKALAAGANSVMVGRLLAGTLESPGNEHYANLDVPEWTDYRGAASEAIQTELGLPICSEGISTKLPISGTVASVTAQLRNGVKSGMSYCGARTIPELQSKAWFCRVTNAGQLEARSY
jgi:IMP dehydrogenase